MKYRYEVVAVGGDVPVSVGQVVRDDFLGPEYTWTIVDLTTGEVVGWFTGRLLGAAGD